MPSTHPEAIPAAAHGWARWRSMLWRLALLAAVLAALHFAGQWATAQVRTHFMPLYELYGARALWGLVALYAAAMALPFVPGMEISLALMVLFGARGAVLVYFATLAALCVAFTVGRLVPPHLIAGAFAWLHLYGAQQLVLKLAPLPPAERLALLLERAPTRLVPFLLRHRYLALALAFNLPGNALIGGGGGIALVAGLSGLFRLLPFALLVALATSPIPGMVLLQAWLRAG